MKNAVIIGATGFGGLGLIDILSKHPEIKITELAAIDHGKKISEMYPHLRGISDQTSCDGRFDEKNKSRDRSVGCG